MSGWALRREEVLDAHDVQEHLADTPQRAAQAILSAAAAGLTEAQALLGQILLDGRGIERDPALALRWFEIAAHAGHLMARNMLGRCHEHGWGCELDATKAAVHYRICAEAGLDWGLYNLANLQATGRGVARDEQAAVEGYRHAAELGHAKSMNLYGRYLEEGHCVARDIAAAHAWYRRSAEAGDFRGQFSHGGVLIAAGKLDEGLAWLEKARQGGHAAFRVVAAQALASSPLPQLQALASAWLAEEALPTA
ncbi:tetratricopeptide repeat protein [Pseudomonas massiliensis]|uniref:tetratricopeptide repeat protein n=1 Tax=Pseudomonas massiliensis TaxID=522492 RepID=UPI00058CB66A|nr:tetratricopeptide repeat protein [Pseudomonas massiliensis]